MSVLSDRLRERASELLARAEFVLEMEQAGEGSSAGVELAAIEDEIRFIHGLLETRLLELIRDRHA